MSSFIVQVGRYRCVALAGEASASAETVVTLADFSDLTCARSSQVKVVSSQYS
jgi:hypothetical protein